MLHTCFAFIIHRFVSSFIGTSLENSFIPLIQATLIEFILEPEFRAIAIKVFHLDSKRCIREIVEHLHYDKDLVG